MSKLNPKTKFIFITGGVVSSLGKGLRLRLSCLNFAMPGL